MTYCSPVWSPYLKSDIIALESVQLSFAKKTRGFFDMPYNERLAELLALSLENIKHYIEMTAVNKFLHGHIDFKVSDVRLHVATSSSKGAGMHLAQLWATKCVSANFFHYVLLRLGIKFQCPFYVHKL